MRRRNLFTLAAGASAGLCIAVCVLWVRCSDVGTADEFVLNTYSKTYGVYSIDGRVYAGAYWDSIRRGPRMPTIDIGADHGGLGFYSMAMMYKGGREFGGFGVCRLDDHSYGSVGSTRQVMAPHWFLA